MTNTQTLIISLAKSLLNSAIDYTLYFDNFFSNSSLVTALEQLDIEIMKTVWVNALELSLSLVQLKHAKETLKWRYLKTAIAEAAEWFLWQDNNQILDMIIYNYLLYKLKLITRY